MVSCTFILIASPFILSAIVSAAPTAGENGTPAEGGGAAGRGGLESFNGADGEGFKCPTPESLGLKVSTINCCYDDGQGSAFWCPWYKDCDDSTGSWMCRNTDV